MCVCVNTERFVDRQRSFSRSIHDFTQYEFTTCAVCIVQTILSYIFMMFFFSNGNIYFLIYIL